MDLAVVAGRTPSLEEFVLAPLNIDELLTDTFPEDSLWFRIAKIGAKKNEVPPSRSISLARLYSSDKDDYQTRSRDDLKAYTKMIAIAERSNRSDSPLRSIDQIDEEISFLHKLLPLIPQNERKTTAICKTRIKAFERIKFLYAIIYQFKTLKQAITDFPTVIFQREVIDRTLLDVVKEHCEAHGYPGLYQECLRNPETLITGSPSLLEEILVVLDGEIERLEKNESSFNREDLCCLIDVVLKQDRNDLRTLLDIFEIGMQPEKERIEVAKHLIRENQIEAFWATLDQFAITEQSALFSLVLATGFKSAWVSFTFLSNSDDSPFGGKEMLNKLTLYFAALIIAKSPSDETAIELIEKWVADNNINQDLLPDSGKSFLRILDKQPMTDGQRLFWNLLIPMMFIDNTTSKKANFHLLFREIFTVLLREEEEVAIDIAFAWEDLLNDSARSNHLLECIKNQDGTIVKQLAISMVYLTKWAADAGDLTLADPIRASLASCRKELRDGKHPMKKALQQALQSLEKSPLSPHQKLRLVQEALSWQDKQDTISALRIYAILADQQCLDTFPLENSITLPTLVEWLSSVTEDKVFRMPTRQENFIETYAMVRDEMRVPFAIETYISRISFLEPPEVKQLGITFIQSLYEGTLQQIRYTTANNPHLAKIPSDLLAEWRRTANTTYKIPIDPSLEVVSSHEFQDLFLAGSEVSSCQSVDAPAKYSVGLLGFVLNGKTQIIAIKDKQTGKIISRSFVRLLLRDNQDGTADVVLYKERNYPTDLPKAHDSILTKAAAERASSLNLDLYVEPEGGGGTDTLFSLPGNTHFEMIDALDGLNVTSQDGYTLQATATSIL